MRAKILRIAERPSKFGNKFYYVFFKSESGESFKTCIYPNYHNFERWKKVIHENSGREIWLDNLTVKAGNLIDADSRFVVEASTIESPTLFDADHWNHGREALKAVRESVGAK